MPLKIEWGNEAFISQFLDIIHNFDPLTSCVRAKNRSNPEALAREIWQTTWRLKADRPEDCLATFVEILVYKFLDDLGLIKTNSDGVAIRVNDVLSVEKDKCFRFYTQNVRPYIKTLFPAGKDGLSIINGIVLQDANRDHNLMFHEMLKKFVRFGPLKDTAPEFKTRLYETFLQESKTTTSFGQFFTPRKVVGAIHDMAGIDRLTSGKVICDPASGVGGFVLEQMARNLDSQWPADGNKLAALHEWHAYEIVPKTAILAKANALVYCGDLLADQPSRVKSFARWLRESFVCMERTSLGALERMDSEVYDLILTNPPFVVSGSADIGKLIKADNKRKTYYGRKSSGVEGLFIQYIVQALKKNGDAWILLPETFFLRTTDRDLRKWLMESCSIDLLAILPERTFFNTPKRVVVCHLKKRLRPLSREAAAAALGREKVLLFAVSEIGETRDAKRLPCETDLPALVTCYRLHEAGVAQDPAVRRAVTISASDLYDTASANLRHHWEPEVAKELGLLGEIADPVQKKESLTQKLGQLKASIDEWIKTGAKRKTPPKPEGWKPVRLGDESLFKLRIGKRVLKKHIHANRTGFNLYSANVRKPFGFVLAANAGGLQYGGALWSIDSDFDCRHVAVGEEYSITDHCGEITILVPTIEPRYLARQVLQAGMDYGFTRDFRPSLSLMADLEITLPVTGDGEFDTLNMTAWADYSEETETKADEIDQLTS